MPKPSVVLEQIQRRAKISRSDCQPLYAYKVTSEELSSLGDCLRERRELHGKLTDVEDCAAFCVFAAETFRRRYESGPWNWDTIYDSMGWPERELQTLDGHIYKVVSRGLQWWGLEVIRLALTNRYLGTLVCQGGLPLNALKQNYGKLTRFLKECLRLHEQYPSIAPRDVVSQRAFMLPASLDNSDFQNLVGSLIAAVAKLRSQSESGLKIGMSRKDYLDKQVPGWDAALPLRVDEPEALNLLLTLLDASKPMVFNEGEFAVSTSLELGGQQAQLRRTLEFPNEIDEARVIRTFGVHAVNDLLPRMKVLLECGGSQVPCLSIVRNREDKYRLSKLDSFDGASDKAEQVVRLILKAGHEEAGSFLPVGGQSLPESPWIFTDSEPHLLIGVGSTRSKHPSVLVALQPSSRLECDEGATAENLERTVAGRVLLRLTGTALVITDDGTYTISSSTANGATSLFELRGREVQLGTQGSRVWLGAPRVSETRLDEEGAGTHQVPNSQVEWRPLHRSCWSPLGTDCYGDMKIRVIEDGRVRFLTNATVMPENFGIQLKASEGLLLLKNLPQAEITVAEKDGYNLAPSNVGGIPVITAQRTEASLEHPGNLTVRIRFAGDNECTLSLPCPLQWMGLTDAAGRACNPNTPIPVERLSGITLRVIQPDHQTLSLFELGHMQFLDRPRPTRVDGVLELNLGAIENYVTGILAQSDEPDAHVDIGLMTRTNAVRGKWRICRYGRRLEKVLEQAQVVEESGFTDFQLEDTEFARILEDEDEVQLTLFPLGRPLDACDAQCVEERGPGLWRVHHANLQSGHYLLIGRMASTGECLRPIRVTIRPKEIPQLKIDEVEPAQMFDAALSLSQKDNRRQAWDFFVNELARNPLHVGWKQMEDVITSCKALPITTFESVAALVRNPHAVVRLAFQRPEESWLWEKLEQLPFLWSLVPIGVWIRGAFLCRHLVTQQLKVVAQESGILSEDTVQQFVQERTHAFVQSAPRRVKGLCGVLGALHLAGFGITPEQLGPYFDAQPLKTREREHTRLINQHDRYDTRLSWPSRRLDLPDIVRTKLMEVPGLVLLDGHPNQWQVLNAPAIAAIYCMYDLPANDAEVKQLQRMRGVDPEWFDVANAAAMYVLIQHRMKQDSHCFEKYVAEER